MIPLLLLACADGGDTHAAHPGRPDDSGGVDSGDTADSGDSGDSGTTAGWSVPSLLDLDFRTVGTAPSGDLAVTGPTDGLTWTVVSGDLAVTGTLPTLTVTFTGDTSAPTITSGELQFTDGVDAVDVDVYVVIGADDLPTGVDWTTDAWGTWSIAPYATAPFPYGGSSYDDPSVLVQVPAGFGDASMGEVLHIHGHNATLADVVADQYLREQASLSGRNALLVVPQGPENAADSDFGRLDTPDGAKNLLRDTIAVAYRDGLILRPELGPVVVTSHSGGYYATAQILDHGGVDVTGVHLFDSLYGYESTFEDYVTGGGRFVSVYTSGGGTDDNNEALRSTLKKDGVTVGESFDDDTLDAWRVIIGYSEASHSGCVSEDRNYGRWLWSSGLPRAPGAPPELRSVVPSGGQVRVTWRDDGAASWQVDGTTTSSTSVEVGASSSLSVTTAEGSDASDIYGATGSDWLIVDGFDRVLGGSWSAPTHGFVAQVGGDLGEPFFSASNEAIADGSVALGSATQGVLWLLGDESTADHTFDDAEMDALQAYVAGGGRLIVSGAEVGYATDTDFLADVLDVAYVSDDAGTNVVDDFEIGAAYPEDYPDVLSGASTIWRYDTGGAAAVGDGQVIVVGFGLENIDPAARPAALQELLGAL